MRTTFGMLLAAMLLWSGDSAAQSALETTDQARQRHGAERWQTYEGRGRQAPLGDYRERLGDPAPYGTEKPGYSSPRSEPSPWSYDEPEGNRY